MIVDRVIKGNLRDQDEDSEPVDISACCGYDKPFYQKKAVDGKGNAADIADQPVEYEHVVVKVRVRFDGGKF